MEKASWWGAMASLAVAVVALALGISCSRSPGGGPPQGFARAGGATLAYTWIGFGQTLGVGSDGTVSCCLSSGNGCVRTRDPSGRVVPLPLYGERAPLAEDLRGADRDVRGAEWPQ